MTSPYLEAAAKRASLISKNYNHDPKHFAFPRTQTVPGDLEQTVNPESWLSLGIGGVLMVIAFAAVCLTVF